MNKKRNLLLTILVVAAVFAINFFTGEIFNGIAKNNKYLADFLIEFKCAALAVLGAVILKKMWIYRRFDTALLKKGWTAALPELYIVLSSIYHFLASRQGISAGPADILLFVLMMICVGVYEETLFRGLLQNAFHEFFDEDTVGHVILAVVCAGVCFGSLHLANTFRPGVSFSDAAIQACSACGAGIYFGAIYFRTGKNLWFVMLVHGIHDTVVFLVQGALSGTDSSAVIAQSSQNTNMISAIIQAATFAAIGLFLLRKNKVEPLLKKTENTGGGSCA